MKTYAPNDEVQLNFKPLRYNHYKSLLLSNVSKLLSLYYRIREGWKQNDLHYNTTCVSEYLGIWALIPVSSRWWLLTGGELSSLGMSCLWWPRDEFGPGTAWGVKTTLYSVWILWAAIVSVY